MDLFYRQSERMQNVSEKFWSTTGMVKVRKLTLETRFFHTHNEKKTGNYSLFRYKYFLFKFIILDPEGKVL